MISRCVLVSLVAVSAVLPAEPRFPPPSPRYEVRVEDNVRVPMRDGVRLATDLYRPAGLDGKRPAIMIRTPDDRKSQAAAARMFAGQGYIVVVQDVRGKYDSEGVFTVSANDTRDGSDTLDWMAAGRSCPMTRAPVRARCGVRRRGARRVR